MMYISKETQHATRRCHTYVFFKPTCCFLWRRPLQVHMLSAYEFSRHFHFKLAKHPVTHGGHKAQQQDPSADHAALTEAGANKVRRGIKTLTASVDYQICEGGGNGWLALGKGERVQRYRHDWVIVARKRPNVPVIYGAQGSQTEDEQAMKILVLFFPWVNNVDDATPAVPYIGNFWQPNFNCWRDALRARVFRFGFPTEELKRYVLDFCFVYCLPRSLQLQDGLEANSDNEGLVDDVQMILDEDDLLTATATYVKGTGPGSATTTRPEAPAEEEQEGKTNLYNLTMDMFHRSDAIWGPSRQEAGDRDPALEQIAAGMQAAGGVRDHALARQAAAASRRKEKAKASTQGRLIASAGPSLAARPPLTAAMLYEWLESQPVRQGTNPKQFEFLELVVDRILVEAGLIRRERSVRQTDDPLVWLLHGPPGTGKSHVLGFLRQLFELVGYTYGLEYEVVAFQAVNAADLKGKTIHSAFGFDRQKQGDKAASEEDGLLALAHHGRGQPHRCQAPGADGTTTPIRRSRRKPLATRPSWQAATLRRRQCDLHWWFPSTTSTGRPLPCKHSPNLGRPQRHQQGRCFGRPRPTAAMGRPYTRSHGVDGQRKM